jgi:transcriptional regulator with XRE-family HTH domain
MNLGNAIRMCRVRRELTQKELALRAQISVSYLSLIEKDKRDVSVSTLRRLADGLAVPVGILFFLAADKRELSGLSEDLIGKLSQTALAFLHESEPTPSLV